MKTTNILDTREWSEQQWGQIVVGDERRTRRAVLVGAAMAEMPAASLPKQAGSWGASKAVYRLINRPEVTHEAVSQQHWQQTREEARGGGHRVVLFVQDTSDIDLTAHCATQGVGYLGDGSGFGIKMHSCLAIVPATPGEATAKATVLGLAAQRLWLREQLWPEDETRTERLKRWRESEVWSETLSTIGSPSTPAMWVSVGDRGSDVFEYMHKAHQQGWHLLLRVTQNRRIETPEGEVDHLIEYVRSLPAVASKMHTTRTRTGQAGEDIELQISYTQLWVEPPKLSALKDAPALKLFCIRCWGTRSDGSHIEWILLTDIAVTDRQRLLEIVSWYEHRWLIEEYHKCLKTGTQIEARQVRTVDAFSALLAFSAIVAVRLLVLRTIARQQPQTPAVEQVDPRMVRLLLLRLKIATAVERLTVREFWHGVARLGGFLARKSDGDPGWQTVWDGWQQLQQMFWATQQIVDPHT
jgi:hypothetical protein